MKSKTISRCALISALSIVLLYLSSIMDTLNLAMLVITTCLLCIIVDLEGVKAALITYLATSAAMYLLLPNKFISLSYFIAFGNYAIIKYFIEKMRNIKLEWLFKLMMGNIYITLCYFLAKFIVTIPTDKLPVWGLFIVANVIFVVCDYAISILYGYLNARFSRLSFWRK